MFFHRSLPNLHLHVMFKTLRTKCDLSRLAKRIIRWFNESRSKEKKFDYHFTGKDSRMFVHNFMFLISSVDSFVEDPKAKQHLHALGFFVFGVAGTVYHCLVGFR